MILKKRKERKPQMLTVSENEWRLRVCLACARHQVCLQGRGWLGGSEGGEERKRTGSASADAVAAAALT